MKREELRSLMIDIMREKVEERIEDLLDDISYDEINEFLDDSEEAKGKINYVAEESVADILDEILEDIPEYELEV